MDFTILPPQFGYYIAFMIIIFILLERIINDKEMKNLQKINELGNRLNSILYIDESLEIIKKDFQAIETKEHSEKVEFYVTMISSIQEHRIKNPLTE